ncbi:hypothetical protein B0H15DRAFT_800056 [Mycena belliarum]|uniref:Uncharacterized protein n=1 Tax=Mycena belliarum TaxID=1033014 RepID=A0AAD6XNA8_9AGAR|nr:hypothetical protein B0H15DRAFT_800056 [Mycena belliae]
MTPKPVPLISPSLHKLKPWEYTETIWITVEPRSMYQTEGYEHDEGLTTAPEIRPSIPHDPPYRALGRDHPRISLGSVFRCNLFADELVARTVTRGDFGTPTLTIKCLGRARCREVYIEFDRMSLRWNIPRLDDKGRINLPPGGASKATDSNEQQRNVKRLLAFMDTFTVRPGSEVGWGDMESLFQGM